ncbi:hypothetical protein NDN01_03595 [Sphingomonas sp. QA11]|uniref:hypothetical protein n=1 Tax=Sphingomonas sp. QA11 TaxID=2950605 RepID=UPI00234B5780|nr:hypothetical protein [Sphingomonas sp. QA11]WCM28023.1 hypothetical protein NDN01_03595 [Sphingomonas sp. QA11]
MAGLALAGLLSIAMPAVAQETRQAGASASQADGPDAAAQVAEMREALLNAQQEIVRLRAEAANRQELEDALKAIREKNERLSAITDELIAAYQKRYRRGQFLPFDTGRRKFEAELQGLGDRAYDNRWDAAPRRAPAPGANATPPSLPAQQTRPDGQ